MEIVQLQKSHLTDVVSLWNNAVETQGEGYQEYTLSVKQLVDIMDDENFLTSGAVVARRGDPAWSPSGRLVGFALGYVQTVDF